MYNEKIISRLNNLTYLGTLKNANVTMLSKPNDFSDVVKFFAQINTNNVIQKITFKASGCTTFMAMCSFFCEMIENKSIEDALKITKENFEQIIILPEIRTHVYSIILNTFALLIKKYRKGIEKGVIIPCEVITNQRSEEQKEVKTNFNKVNINYDLDDVLYKENKQKKKVKETKQDSTHVIERVNKTTNNIDIDNKEESIEEDLNTINEEIVTIEAQMPLEETIIIEEPIIEKTKKIAKKSKKSNTIIAPQTEIDHDVIIEEQSQIQPSEKIKEEVVKHKIVVKQETITKEENNQEIVETQVQKEVIRTIEVKKTISENQASHLLALQSKVNKHNQEVRKEKAQINTNHLNSMLAKLHEKEENNTQTENVKSMKRDISLLQNEIANLKSKKPDKEEIEEIEPETKKEQVKEKKSLFSWFSRK